MSKKKDTQEKCLFMDNSVTLPLPIGIFGAMTKRVAISDTTSILSFGCSYGDEVRSIRSYFDKPQIHGVDINREIINQNREKFKDPRITFHKSNEMTNVDVQFDIVFAMSVLCRHPDSENFQFDKFDELLKTINRYVKPGGYIVLYNAKYHLMDSSIATRYIPIEDSYKVSNDCVVKHTPLNVVTESGPYFAFFKSF